MPAYKHTHFEPLKSDPHRHLIASFDTEGNGLPDGFVCGSVVCGSGNHLFYNRASMLEFLLSPALRNTWIFAHNLDYDLGVLTGGDMTPFNITFNGSSILWAEYYDEHKHKRLFLDSLNLFPGARVEDLGLDVGKMKLELHPFLKQWLIDGKPLEPLDRDDQWRVTSYCLRDAEIIFDAVSQLQEELMSLGGELHPTVSGCSMDLFRRKFMQASWPIVDENINRLARQAYYGARCEPYRLGRVSGVNGYDYSSLYPSIMSQAQFPHPGKIVQEIQPNQYHHLLKRDGIAQVSVFIPDHISPPLPVRVDRKLFFPSGQASGCWTLSELRNACDSGVEILSCDWILFSYQTFNPFVDFIESLYKLRVLHAQDSKLKERFFKLLMNSAYGRYGLNPDNTLTDLVPIRKQEDFETYRGGYFYLWRGYPYILYPRSQTGQPAYANALIASYISAGARIKMHGQITANLEGLCYTDTDSLWTSGEIASSSGLGQLRKTHSNLDLWVVAPKEYAVFSGEHLEAAYAKGIPSQYQMTYLKEGKAVFKQPNTIRDSVKRNLTPAEWAMRLKTSQQTWPKRAPILDRPVERSYFETRAWTVEELRQTLEHWQPESQAEGWYRALLEPGQAESGG